MDNVLLRTLPEFSFSGPERKQLTWGRIHLTYPFTIPGGPQFLLTQLEGALIGRGLKLLGVSAGEETSGTCILSGFTGPRTYFALDIAKGEAERFRICSSSVFELGGQVPKIHLLRGDGNWEYICGIFHCRISKGIRRGTATVSVADSAGNLALYGASSREDEGMRADYESLSTGNVRELQESMKNVAMEAGFPGGLYWFGEVSGAVRGIPEWCANKGKALLFDGIWSAESVASRMRECLRVGVRPDQIMFRVLRNSGREPSREQLGDFYLLCEHIRDGIHPGRRDQLKEWKPAVFVYADFYPCLYDERFNVNRWAVCLPGFMHRYDHLLCARPIARTIAESTRDIDPQSTVVDMQSLRAALADTNRGSMAELSKAFFQIFSMSTLLRYWEAGYRPVVRVVNLEVFEWEINPKFGPNGILPGLDADLNSAVEFSQISDAAEVVGTSLRMGRVLVISRQLSAAAHRQVLDWIAKQPQQVVAPAARAPVYVEGESARPMNDAWYEYDDYDSRADIAQYIATSNIPIESNVQVPGAPPGVTARWILRTSRRITVLELDMVAPGASEARLTLWALKAGARVVRIHRTAAPPKDDWKEPIKAAIMGLDRLIFLGEEDPEMAQFATFIRSMEHVPSNAWETAILEWSKKRTSE